MKSYRILHIDTERGWRGGENQAMLLAEGLRARGHDNMFLAQPNSALCERAKEKGFRVGELKMRGDLDFIARYQIGKIVDAVGVDILHAHTSHAHSIALAAAERRGGKPKLVITRRVDFPVGQGWFSRRKYLAPSCHYIAISNGVRDALAKGGVSPDRIRVVHSGVDPARFTYRKTGEVFRQAIGCGPDEPLVGNVAALTDHKGHVYLIAAAEKVLSEIPDARFCVVGDGELSDDLKKLVEEKGLAERFTFAGYQEDIEEALSAFDVFALSSHLEGLCTSVIDAMLIGAPVVATETGGVPDLVINQETGLLVPPREANELAGAILMLLKDADLRRHLSESARAHATENFTMEQMVSGAERVYHEIMAS